MRANLRYLHSPDVEDLASWLPTDEAFAILVQLLVGPEDGPGEESFDVTVCSPRWLHARASREGIIDGLHHLVIVKYDYPRLEEYLRKRVTACVGQSWEDVALKLSRLGHWEFEDYEGAH